MDAHTDALARHLGQLLTSPDDSAEWRVAREFALLDHAGREKLVHDIIEVYGAGDPECQVAARLRDLMDADAEAGWARFQAAMEERS